MMMKAVNTSETSVNFYQTTRRNIQKDSNFHIRCCKNLDLILHVADISNISLIVSFETEKVKQSRYTPWRRLGGEEV
jgi:hypothetical protein